MKKFLVLSVLCSLIACSSSSATKEDKPEEQQPKNVYRNPVIDYSLPDPSVIEGDDGYYYLYATEDIRNLPIHRSKNLVDWEYVGTAFTDRTRPDFEPNGGLWAPDINKIGDKYVLYYSMSVWGGELTCGIGCATADKPEGPLRTTERCSAAMKSMYRTPSTLLYRRWREEISFLGQFSRNLCD